MKLLLLLSLPAATALLMPTAARLRSSPAVASPRQVQMSLDRRSALGVLAALPVAFVSTSPAVAATDKVVIFGGSGYVGAHAAQMLLGQGAQVVSVSRKSSAEQADKVKAILGTDLKLDYVSLDASTADLTAVLAGATAVISCVGIAPGGANQRAGNGAVNARIADAAKAAGIGRFVYLGVASELANGPIKFIFGDYVKGKAEAEAAVAKDFGAAALVLKPGIIGGAPPGEIRPPGPPGMAPVSVEAVAAAAVAGALGKKTGSVDGNAAIAAASA